MLVSSCWTNIRNITFGLMCKSHVNMRIFTWLHCVLDDFWGRLTSTVRCLLNQKENVLTPLTIRLNVIVHFAGFPLKKGNTIHQWHNQTVNTLLNKRWSYLLYRHDQRVIPRWPMGIPLCRGKSSTVETLRAHWPAETKKMPALRMTLCRLR